MPSNEYLDAIETLRNAARRLGEVAPDCGVDFPVDAIGVSLDELHYHLDDWLIAERGAIRCSVCNSIEVQMADWIDPNDRVVIGDLYHGSSYTEDPSDTDTVLPLTWCRVCDEHTPLHVPDRLDREAAEERKRDRAQFEAERVKREAARAQRPYIR